MGGVRAETPVFFAKARRHFDDLPVGLAICDEDGVIFSANGAFRSAMQSANGSRPDSEGGDIFELMPSNTRMTHRRMFDAAFTQGKQREIFTQFVEGDVINCVLQVTYSPLRKRRKIVGVRVTTADQTPVYVANERLSLALSQLQRTQDELVVRERLAAMGGLVAGIAHEINTPLGNAITAVTHLQEEADAFGQLFAANTLRRADLEKHLAQSKEDLDAGVRNLRRAAHLVNLFKQMAVDRSAGQVRRFRLLEYITDVVESLRPQLKRLPHRVEVSCPDDAELDADPGAFAQVLTNLISNSLTHGLDPAVPGEMRIEVIRGDDCLRLVYEDDGTGIPAEIEKHIFEPFFTTKRESGGTGLGLAIVSSLVTRSFHGTITYQPRNPRGVRFVVVLPTGPDPDHGNGH